MQSQVFGQKMINCEPNPLNALNVRRIQFCVLPVIFFSIRRSGSFQQTKNNSDSVYHTPCVTASVWVHERGWFGTFQREGRELVHCCCVKESRKHLNISFFCQHNSNDIERLLLKPILLLRCRPYNEVGVHPLMQTLNFFLYGIH